MKRRVIYRSYVAMLLAGSVAAIALACERALVPQHSAIGDLRRQATDGSGPFVGRVRVRDGLLPCWRSARVAPGVRVDVGLWDGSPAFYRDTLTRQPPTAANDPRFQLLASTTTDADGRFRFDSMPRRFGYAMRVIPPNGSPWKVSYGESMYGVPNEQTLEALQAAREGKVPAGGTHGDFPILCVAVR